MADSKISALTDGSPLVSTDEFVIARGVSDYKIPASSIDGVIFSGARVYSSLASISIANSTLTAVSFNSERFDTDNYHEGVTHPTRLTIPVSGYYVIGACLFWAAAGGGWRSVRIRVNGTQDIVENAFDSPGSADVIVQPLSTLWQFTAGDYAELYAFQSSGGALNILGAGTAGVGGIGPEFWITKQ